jgi:hypothetical protein
MTTEERDASAEELSSPSAGTLQNRAISTIRSKFQCYLTKTFKAGSSPLPFTPADESYLQETLTECRVKLESALATAKGYSRLPDLAVALSDAITGCMKPWQSTTPKPIRSRAMSNQQDFAPLPTYQETRTVTPLGCKL